MRVWNVFTRRFNRLVLIGSITAMNVDAAERAAKFRYGESAIVRFPGAIVA